MKMHNCWKTGLMVAALAAGCNGVRAQDDKMGGSMDKMGGSMSEMRMKNAKMLVQTLSEEKTEINQLLAQQMAFKKMGDRDSKKIAAMWGRWAAEHKAAGPMLMKLIKNNGGDPMQAKVMKPPVLGDKATMLMATHKDHEAAVMTSQMRFGMTNDSMIKMAMHKRGNLARKHLAQMKPFHKEMVMMNMGMMKTGTMKTGTMDKMGGAMGNMKTQDTTNQPMTNGASTDMGAGMNTPTQPTSPDKP